MIVWTVLLAYLAVLVALGLIARSSSDVGSYYAADKRLPSWVVAFSANATGESGWLLLGLTGMGYLVGIHALWVVMGEVLGVALAWVFVARPFKRFTDAYDSITVPDFLESRFHDRRSILRILSVCVILSMVLAYLAAQLVATGKAFQTFMQMDYQTGVLLGAAITLFYTAVGGFKAVAYSDMLQGVLMAGGLALLAITGVLAAGGWTGMMSQLHSVDPALLYPMGAQGWSLAGLASVLGFLGIGLAFLGAPQLLVRFLSASSEAETVRAAPIAVGCIIIFDLGAVFAGIAGRTLYPNLADPESVMPRMSADLFPEFITGVLMVVVLGAVMSTVDSLLILASSAVVRDLVQKVFRPELSSRQLAHLGVGVTLILGIAAIPVAQAEVRVIFWFVLFAWSGLASAFAPVVLCSLFWRRTTLAGAVAGMVSGFSMTVIWVLFFKSQFYGLYEMLPGFVAGFAANVGVSFLTSPGRRVVADYERIWGQGSSKDLEYRI